MTRLATLAALIPGAAFAHPGHIAEANGHDHFALLAGFVVIGLAFAPVLWRLVRR